MKTLSTKIQLRTDTLANWFAANPTLLNGEIAVVKDISAGETLLKIGNGISAFTSLPFFNSVDKAVIQQLSNDIEKKIFISDPAVQLSGYSDLSVLKVTKDQYEQYVANENPILSGNVLFIVSSDTIDAYGQRIVRVGSPTLSDDAATKKYVDDSILAAKDPRVDGLMLSVSGICAAVQLSVGQLSEQAQQISAQLSNDIKAVSSSLSGYYLQTETSSANQLYTEFNRRAAIFRFWEEI